MSAVQNVLVVGAGAAGTATAIRLAEQGVSVDLVDVHQDISAVGSGITLQGNALRVLRDLGVWDRVRDAGYAFGTLGLRAPDALGTLLVELDDILTGGPGLPATMGIYRPTLARILLDRAVDAGAKIRFGTTCTHLLQDAEGVEVTFADESTGRYDLVVGADGIRSWTRRHLGITLQTRNTGMGIWRVFARRPPSVTRSDLYYGGPCYIAGYTPTGADTLYAYLVEDAQDRSSLTPEESLRLMVDLSQAYHGPWDEIRVGMTDPTKVNYTWFETHVLEPPWHRGRVILVGDAAHACPPTLAQGAAQALEDAVVLTEILLAADELTDEVLQSVNARRYPRAKVVVDGSVQLGQWMLDHEQGDVPALMIAISHLLSEPA